MDETPLRTAAGIATPGHRSARVYDNGNGVVSDTPTAIPGKLLSSELEAILAGKEDVSMPAATMAPHDERAIALAEAAARPGESIRIMVEVEDPGFEWSTLRALPAESIERESAILARKQQVELALAAFTSRMADVEAKEIGTHWLIPAVSFRVPASKVAAVADWPGNFKVRLDAEAPVKYLENYTGLEARNGMLVTQFHQSGYRGQAGSRSGGQIRVGIADSAELNWKHPGLGGYYSSFFPPIVSNSRFAAYWDCQFSSCVSYVPSAVVSHGTGVAGLAIGTIENGEDINFSDPSLRIERSGMAPSAKPYYYSSTSNGGYVSSHIAILERAVADGLDVLNHSYEWFICNPCDKSCDGGGYLQAEQNSQAAGLLNVHAAGNAGDAGSCSVNPPASFRQGLAVAALNSNDRSLNIHTMGIWSGTARGGMDMTINGSTWAQVESLVDMAAPGCDSRVYAGGEPWSGAYGIGCGTSYAAPKVTALVALVRNAWTSLGQSSLQDPDWLLANTLLMTDGWGAASGGVTQSRFDIRTGAGRVHAWILNSTSLVSPWGWGCHAFTMTATGQSQTYTVGDSGPESPSISQWKAAMYFIEPHHDNAADIDMAVENTCPSGGGSPVAVAIDSGRDSRSRLRLTSGSIANKCLRMKIYAIHIPQGQSRDVFVCDYYHSGPLENH